MYSFSWVHLRYLLHTCNIVFCFQTGPFWQAKFWVSAITSGFFFGMQLTILLITFQEFPFSSQFLNNFNRWEKWDYLYQLENSPNTNTLLESIARFNNIAFLWIVMLEHLKPNISMNFLCILYSHDKGTWPTKMRHPFWFLLYFVFKYVLFCYILLYWELIWCATTKVFPFLLLFNICSSRTHLAALTYEMTISITVYEKYSKTNQRADYNGFIITKD